MIWVVDKKIVRHLIQEDGRLAELPIRVSFEYAVEDGTVLDGSLSLKPLYNKPAVCREFPDMDDQRLDDEVQATVERAIDEHLALCGYQRETAAAAELPPVWLPPGLPPAWLPPDGDDDSA